MSDLKEHIDLLITLQAKDSSLDELNDKAAVIPLKIDEMNDLMKKIRSDFEERKKNLVQLQVKRKEKELELDSKESEIKKHNIELNSVKTNDTYKALLTQIDNCKQQKSLLENDILDIMEKVENESKLIKTFEIEQKEKESIIKTEINKLEVELNNLKAAISNYDTERAEYLKKIPENILSNYERIRNYTKGTAIVHLEGEKCSACHMYVRPQLINEICKGQEIVACDNCLRILYKK